MRKMENGGVGFLVLRIEKRREKEAKGSNLEIMCTARVGTVIWVTRAAYGQGVCF